jgi:two-component system phosphate regulon sensor histidine kinase PhoR
MNLGVRGRIFVVTLGLLWIGLLAGYGVWEGRVLRGEAERTASDLESRLRLVAEHLAGLDATTSSEGLSRVVRNLAAAADSQLTLIDRDGAIVAQATAAGAAVRAESNQASAADVVQAKERGMGRAQHVQDGHRRMYLAVPWRSGASIVGTVRLTHDVDRAQELELLWQRSLVAAALGTLILALLVALAATHLGSRAARRLTDVAKRMSAGDLSVRSEPVGKDEFAVLGRALDGLAESLSETLGALRSEKDRLDRVLSSMREGVLLVDAKGVVQVVNSALIEMLYLDRNPVGKSVHDVMGHPEVSELLELALSGESHSMEISVRTPVGRRILASARTLPRRGGVLAVLVDVTEQRRLETVRQEFVANASHELRTPIAAVISAVETLQSILVDVGGDEARFVAMIGRNAQRLKTLVDDLLALSHIESGTIEAHAQPVKLRPFVEGIMNDFAPNARAKQTKLVSLVPSDLSALADPRGLQHVVGNLVDNAIKYCPEGATVKVVARQEGRRVAVRVIDDGPGIAEEHRDRIFERFYRVDAGRSRALGGTGLGLAIVKHWLEAMGGSIEVAPAEPRGTEFRITFEAVPLDSG